MTYKLLSLYGDAETNAKANIHNVPEGHLPCFVLDANVCLNIVRHCRNPLQTHQHIKDSNISIVTKSDILSFDIIPFFGVFELCIDKRTYSFDQVKFGEFITLISQFIEAPPNKIAKDSYVQSIKPHKVNFSYGDKNASLKRLIKIIYASMLRIAYISKKNGLKKDQSIANLKKFLTWSDEILDISILPPVLASLAIFGGETISRKAIKLESNNYKDIIDGCWGCAWDFLYYYIMQHPDFVGVEIENNLKLKHFSVLVTEDTALHSILSNNEAVCAFTNKDEVFLTANAIRTDFPHYKNNQLATNKALNDFMSKRINFLKQPVSDNMIDYIVNDSESELIALLTS